MTADEPVTSAAAEAVTRVGVRGGAVAVVDRAGRVDLGGRRGAIDWWIGADDRWHRPGVEAAVRQRRLEDGPVVETRLRVPGGDAVQRVFGARLATATGPADHLVIEVENRSRLPVVAALVAGPATVVSQDGRVSSSGATPVVVAPRAPSRLAAAAAGDLFPLVASGGAEEGDRAQLVDDQGRAALAALWPLPHSATMRFLVPLAATNEGVGRGGPPCGEAPVPSAEQVARGWRRQVEADVRVELPDAAVAAAVTASRSELLLGPGAGAGSVDPGLALAIVRAASRWGHHDVVGDGLAALTEAAAATASRRARSAGARPPTGNRHEDAAAALVSALADAWRLGASDAISRWLGRELPVAGDEPTDRGGGGERAGARSSGATSARPGVPAAEVDGASVELGGRLAAVVAAAVARVDDGLGRRGLEPDRRDLYRDALGDAAELFEVAGQPAAADDVRRLARRRRARSSGGPDGRAGGGDIGRTSTPPLGAGRGWEVVRRWVGEASPTCTWAEPTVAPRLLAGVRAVLLDDPPDGSLALAPGWPSAWWGAPISVTRLASRRGRVSWALRWHGDRPALLWEVEASGSAECGLGPPVLSAPALDPAWRGTGWRGEALLTPVRPPVAAEGHEPDDRASFR